MCVITGFISNNWKALQIFKCVNGKASEGCQSGKTFDYRDKGPWFKSLFFSEKTYLNSGIDNFVVMTSLLIVACQ